MKTRKYNTIIKALIIGSSFLEPTTYSKEAGIKEERASEKIQVIKKVDVKEEYGTLVHIKITHMPPPGELLRLIKKAEATYFLSRGKIDYRGTAKESIRKFLKRMSDSQKQTYRIIRKINPQRVYVEGYERGERPSLEELARAAEREHREIRQLGMNRIDSIQSPLETFYKLKKENIEIIGADTYTSKEETKQVLTELKKGDLRRIRDKREKKTIEYVLQYGEGKTRIIVYGKKHNFVEEVQRWNKSHPREQFDLVEIITRDY